MDIIDLRKKYVKKINNQLFNTKNKINLLNQVDSKLINYYKNQIGGASETVGNIKSELDILTQNIKDLIKQKNDSKSNVSKISTLENKLTELQNTNKSNDDIIMNLLNELKQINVLIKSNSSSI